MIILLKQRIRYWGSALTRTGRQAPCHYYQYDTHTMATRRVTHNGIVRGSWDMPTRFYRQPIQRLLTERHHIIVKPVGGSILLPPGV